MQEIENIAEHQWEATFFGNNFFEHLLYNKTMNIILLLYAFSATPLFIYLVIRAFKTTGKTKRLFFSICALYILIGQIIHFFLPIK